MLNSKRLGLKLLLSFVVLSGSALYGAEPAKPALEVAKEKTDAAGELVKKLEAAEKGMGAINPKQIFALEKNNILTFVDAFSGAYNAATIAKRQDILDVLNTMANVDLKNLQSFSQIRNILTANGFGTFIPTNVKLINVIADINNPKFAGSTKSILQIAEVKVKAGTSKPEVVALLKALGAK